MSISLAQLQSNMAEWIATQLGFPANTVPYTTSFQHFGLTSTHLVSFVRHLEAELKRTLSPILAWEYPNIAELAGFLVNGRGSVPDTSGLPLAPDEGEEIALVGMSCRFPGSPSVEAFWKLCWEGTDAITEVPPERWDVDAFYDPDPATPGKTYARWGGFLREIERFDPAFFEISPREAIHLDPRQRLLLETSWEAFEDAGVPPQSLKGSATGVFVATLTDDYAKHIFSDRSGIEAHTGTGTAHSIVANRLSYFYDFHGPSLSVDTACSGSLVAVHLACQSLRRGECTAALAGGVNLLLHPDSTLFFSRAAALAKDGRCKAFDSRANGFVRSDGVGVVVLKRLSTAQADGDRIYAVIRGSAINQDGRTNGIMAPNPQSQEALLRLAYRNAGVSPGIVQYVEAHGTGTPLGDPIETQALGAVLGDNRPPNLGCLIGSVKTNIGHTEAAAGIAGIIKVASAIYRQKLPGSLHYQSPNPLIPFERLPFKVAARSGEWPDANRRLIAGVSGFGFGGTNAHVVLASPPSRGAPKIECPPAENGPIPLLFSAHNVESARKLAAAYACALDETTVSLGEFARAAALQRSHLQYRVALAAVSKDATAQELRAFARGDDSPRISSGTAALNPGRLAFVFSGQGSHWAGMGLGLLRFPAFADALQRCEEITRRHAGFSLLEQLRTVTSARFNDTDIAQVAVCALQCSLAALLQALGLKPDVVVGQSLGEVAAAYTAGALNLDDAMLVAINRSRLMLAAQGRGRSAQIELSVEQTRQLLEARNDVCVAGSSSPGTTLIAGDTEAVESIIRELQESGGGARMLKGIDLAFHSPAMDPFCAPLAQSLREIAPRAAEIPFFSTVTGSYVAGRKLHAQYWADNLRQPFDLSGAIAQLSAEGVTTFVEISPHAVLGASLLECLRNAPSPCIVIPTLKRNGSDAASLCDACVRLYAAGRTIAWFGHERGPIVALPHYTWHREAYWFSPRAAAVGARSGLAHPLLGPSLRLSIPPHCTVWETDLSPREPHFLADHRLFDKVVIPGAAYVEMALAAFARQAGPGVLGIRNLRFTKALVLPDDTMTRIHVTLRPTGTQDAEFEVHSLGASTSVNGGMPIRHAHGQVFRVTGATPSSRVIREIADRCPRLVNVEENYKALSALGLDYGERFRVLSEIRLGEGEALAVIRAPATLAHDWSRFCIPPSCLDGMFQLVAPLVADVGLSGVFLPAAIDALEWYERPPTEVLAHARLRPTARGDSVLAADLELFSREGVVVARVTGFRIQLVGSPQTERDFNEPARWLYEVAWEEAPSLVAAAPRADAPHAWLIVDGGTGLALALRRQLEQQGHLVATLVEGGPAAIDGTIVVPRVDLRCSDHYTAVLAALKRHVRTETPIGVIDTSALGACDEDPACCQRLAHTAISLVQGVVGSGLPARLWMLTRGSQPARNAVSASGAIQAIVWGIGRVALHQEYPAMRGGLIDLDEADDLDRIAKLVLDECKAHAIEDQVAFRGDIRMVPRLRRLPLPDVKPPVLETSGAYLVTGGFGALGRATMRWLCAHGARRIVVFCRTSLPPRSSWLTLDTTDPRLPAVNLIFELENAGCTIEVVAADVGDYDAIADHLALRKQERRPAIRGIIHAAGSLSDAQIPSITIQDIHATFRAKVEGLQNLGRAFGDDGLDFLVVCSSMAALTPNIGQAVYAAANTFVDAWCSHLRNVGVPCLGINWGPWKSGVITQAGAEFFHASRGWFALEDHVQTAMLDRLLHAPQANLAVCATDWPKFKAGRAYTPSMIAELCTELAIVGAETGAHTKSTFLSTLRHAGPRQRMEIVTQHLADVVAWVLRMPADRIEPGQPLITLGLDSMMATELKNRLESSLGLRLTASDLLKGITLHQIGGRILDTLKLEPAPDLESLAVAGGADLDDALAAIEQMTPEQLAAELGEGAMP